MKTFRVGLIGLGSRGRTWVKDVLLALPYVRITALCDLFEDHMQMAADMIREHGGGDVQLMTRDYRQLIDSDVVDTVLVCSGWSNHFHAAIYAMKCGKAVGMEVGGAYSVEQCWELVRTYEATKTPIMLLENCCYGERELTVTHMARKGLFGTVVHCEGGYCHDLRKALAGEGRPHGHYRTDEYINRNCESYPTHELGPIAKLLDIGNGNRFVSLVSMASKSAGMRDYLAGTDNPYANTEFRQGDIFTTLIKCADGTTIKMMLDTTLPGYYSRDFTVRGTKGMYEERTNSVFLEENEEHCRDHWSWEKQWGNLSEMIDEYRHPLWKHYREQGVRGTHDGMDYLVISAFFDALDKGQPMPIDVYDAVSWMVVTVLSEQSVATGSTPVTFPDFTNGGWMIRKPPVDSIYNLR